MQLANAGAPIAGDPLYGGAPAPRLLLHAQGLTIRDPESGAVRRFEAPVPEELTGWLERGDLGAAVYDDEAALVGAIALACRRRYGLGRAAAAAVKTTAFRVVHELGDALPELAVDVYGDSPRRPLLWNGRRVRQSEAARAGARLALRARTRRRVSQGPPETGEHHRRPAPRGRRPSPPRPRERSARPPIIHEEGMPFAVRLGDGLSTGIFLDQRKNRRLVRELAKDKTVLNLFAYTCGFTVAAALGGARGTISVDAAAAALERGRENLALAGVSEMTRDELVADDAFRWLARAGRQRSRFDLIVLDPPSYSTTKHRRFVSKTDYAELAAAALLLSLPAGGSWRAPTIAASPAPSSGARCSTPRASAKVEVLQIKDLPRSAGLSGGSRRRAHHEERAPHAALMSGVRAVVFPRSHRHGGAHATDADPLARSLGSYPRRGLRRGG